ncbi:MAG: PilN domain-containing protein [Gaiellaceae bacterium]
MRAVNLLPRDLSGQRTFISQQNVPALVGAGLGILVTGALALGVLHESGRLSTARGTLANLQTQVHSLPPQAQQQPGRNAQLAGEQNARILAVSNAIGARLAFDRILREFSLVLPNDVWLSTMTLSVPDPAQVAAGSPRTDFSINGTTYSHDSVARLLTRLALIPDLENVNLTNSTRQVAPGATQGGVGASTVQFNITAGIKPAPGAAAALAPAPVVVPPSSTDTTSTGAGA